MGSAEVRNKLRAHIAKLADKDTDLTENSQYWKLFWILPSSIDEISSVLTPSDIRYFRDNHIDAFTKLVLNITKRLIYLSKIKNEKLKNFPVNHLLNCIRILTLIFPFIYEKRELDYIEKEIFWNTLYNNDDTHSQNLNSGTNGTNSATIGSITNESYNEDQTRNQNNSNLKDLKIETSLNNLNINSDDHSSNNKSPGDSNSSTSLNVNHDVMIHSQKPIGAELVFTCLNLLFTLDFTVESKTKIKHKSDILANDYQAIVWESGLESVGDYNDPNLKFDSNRLEILRLMTVLFSKTLYGSISEANNVGSRFLTVLVSCTDKIKFQVLCLSLWNLTIRSLKSNDDNNPNLNGLELPDEDQKHLRISLVTNSIQMFTLMAVYSLPKKDLSFLFKHNLISQIDNQIPKNGTRYFLNRITEIKDLKEIVMLLSSSLLKPMIENNNGALSYIMKSSKLIEDKELHIWSTELMMILLEFYQCNYRFRAIFSEMLGPEFLILMIYYILKFKNEDKEAKYKDFISLCVYILLIFSSDIRLVSKILTTFDLDLYDSLPSILRTSTTPTSYRDFLIIHISNILNSENTHFMSLPLFQILYNLITAHITLIEYNKKHDREILKHRKVGLKDLMKCPPNQISYGASISLIHLVTKLTNINTLSKNPDTESDYISLLLIAFCQVILRDSSGSIILMFILCKNSALFSKLFVIIKKVSDQIVIEMKEREKREYDFTNQYNAQTQQQQQQQAIEQSRQNSRPNTPSFDFTESRESIDMMPQLSRQNTQNTLESIPSIRSIPVISKQISHISIPSTPKNIICNNNNNNFDDSIDPMNITNVIPENNSNDLASIISNTDEIFKAELPLYMSDKSKGKRAYYEFFENKWSGKESLDILRNCIKAVTKVIDFNNKDNNKINEASIIIQQMFKIDFEPIFNNIKISYFYCNDKTSFEPLKFKWDNNSLGWYISLIWGSIFLNYNIYESKGILAEISSSFSVIKKVSTSWGFGSWKLNSNNSYSSSTISSPLTNNSFSSSDINNDKDEKELYYHNLLKYSIWFGTHIELFKVNPVIIKDHFILQHGKSEYNNLGFGTNNFVLGNENFWRRGSGIPSSPIQQHTRNGSGVFTEGFWKRQSTRPGSLDRRDSDGSLKMQLSRNSNI